MAGFSLHRCFSGFGILRNQIFCARTTRLHGLFPDAAA